MRYISSLLFSFLILLSAQSASAETQYVSDILRVDLRSGPSNEYRIIAILKSGTKLDILKNGDNEDWTKVATGSGDDRKEGWIRTQYLVSEPIARDKLEQAQRELSLLKDQKGKQGESILLLNSELSQLKAAYDKLDKEHRALTKEHEKLSEISSNAVALDQKNRDLLEERERLKHKVEELTLSNTKLEHDQYVDGITHGGIAVILGALLAIFLTNFNFRKKRSEW